MVTAEALLLVTVTVFAALVVPTAWAENVKEAGENLSAAVPPPDPVPESATVCGLYATLFVRISAPVTLPLAVGWNVALSVQVALPASVAPHGLVPLAETL